MFGLRVKSQRCHSMKCCFLSQRGVMDVFGRLMQNVLENGLYTREQQRNHVNVGVVTNKVLPKGLKGPRGSAAVAQSFVFSAAQLTPQENDMYQLGTALRNIGWISFWSQLILSTVSGVVLLFSTGVTSGGNVAATPTDVCTLVGVACGLITSMLSWTWIRAGRKLQELKSIKLQQCMGSVLASTNLNLVGMGATIVGLQASVGALVAKTLTSAAGGMAYYNPRVTAPPVAFDVFTVQSCTNTIMAHFVGLVLAQWLLGILRKFIQKEEEAMN